jgi:hypothetical protein
MSLGDGFTPHESGHIDGSKYDPVSRKMTIRFQNGYEYVAHGVPQQTYQDFLDASSQGEHYHSVIKLQHHIERVK